MHLMHPALNAASVIFLAVALLLWHRESAEPTSRERFVSALRAGGRYVWHEPVVRRIMLRAIMFVAPAMGLWAQLPVIASQHLRVGTDGFGALFAALGTGAIVGALLLGRLKNNMSINGILTAGAVLYAAALAVIIFVPSFPIALATLVLSGVAWMAITSTLQAEMQLVLPGWVRDRGMALYTVTFMGSQTAGALICGVFRSAGDGSTCPP
jgi:predicted MFS family arabinose efflux permease